MIIATKCHYIREHGATFYAVKDGGKRIGWILEVFPDLFLAKRTDQIEDRTQYPTLEDALHSFLPPARSKADG